MCESKCGSVFPNERLDPTQQHNNYTCGQESGQWSSVIHVKWWWRRRKKRNDCYYCIQSMWKISHWFTITFPVQNHLIGNKAGWLYFCSFVLYAWLLTSASETTAMPVQWTLSFQFGQCILATSWIFSVASIQWYISGLCNRLDKGQQARSKNSLVEKGFRKKKRTQQAHGQKKHFKCEIVGVKFATIFLNCSILCNCLCFHWQFLNGTSKRNMNVEHR